MVSSYLCTYIKKLLAESFSAILGYDKTNPRPLRGKRHTVTPTGSTGDKEMPSFKQNRQINRPFAFQIFSFWSVPSLSKCLPGV